MELRGEIRGGRFVGGFAGEQFALPQAVELLRKLGREGPRDLVAVAANDPLVFAGILTPQTPSQGGKIGATGFEPAAFWSQSMKLGT
jgi:ATP-dependent Lhr-like helicase